jgi:hypothetical protein
MTFKKYKEDLQGKIATHGFTACHFTNKQIKALYYAGADIDQAYNIYCDVYCGFSFYLPEN